MIKLLVETEPFQRAASLFIRYQVFVLEGDIDLKDEFDGLDGDETVYAVIYDDELPVSTGRFIQENDETARLTRIATRKEYRGKGFAAEIITALEKYAQEHGFKHLVIHSELTAKTFYEGIGYQAFGPIYQEDQVDCQSLEKYL